MKLNHSKLDKIVHSFQRHKHIFGMSFAIQSASDPSLSWNINTGNFEQNPTYYIASINKMILTALFMQLVSKKIVSMDQPINSILLPEDSEGLFLYNGKDISMLITPRHLLTQTSGLPCYLTDPQPDGIKLMTRLHNGENISVSYETMQETIQKIPKKYLPDLAHKRAYYSETNFRLAAKLIERITGQSLQHSINELSHALEMNNTYLLPGSGSLPPVYHKAQAIQIDNYWKTTGYDIASTARDQLLFLRAFFSGVLFPIHELDEMMKFRKIFFPFQYGTGLQRFSIPRLFTPFSPQLSLIGHSGSIGSAAFFIPQKNVYIAGTINQSASPQRTFQLMMKLAGSL